MRIGNFIKSKVLPKPFPFSRYESFMSPLMIRYTLEYWVLLKSPTSTFLYGLASMLSRIMAACWDCLAMTVLDLASKRDDSTFLIVPRLGSIRKDCKCTLRSEERRVGKEGRCRCGLD